MNASGNTTRTMTGGRPSTTMFDEFLGRLDVIQSVLTPILVTVGILGNTFTIIVVSERRFKQMNCTVMLVGLAVSDILMVLTTSLNQNFMTSLPVDIRALSTFGCKLYYIVYRSAKVSSSWIVVLIAVERFFAVVFPRHFRTLMCRRNVVIMMVSIYVVAIGYNIVWSTTSTIKRGICFATVTTNDTEQLNFILVLLRGIQYSFIPIAILTCVTPPIIFTLVTRQRRQARMVSNVTAARTARELSRTTSMLIIVVILHVIGSLPFTILFIRSVFYGESIFTSSDRTYFMFFLVSPTIEQINHSSNFFIYVLFSKLFRKRVFEILRNRCRATEPTESVRNGITPIASVSSRENQG